VSAICAEPLDVRHRIVQHLQPNHQSGHGPPPIRRLVREYAQGLHQSDNGSRNMLRASTNQTTGWGIYSGPPPIRQPVGEYTQDLHQSGSGLGNMLRASTNQATGRGICSGPPPIRSAPAGWRGSQGRGTCPTPATVKWQRYKRVTLSVGHALAALQTCHTQCRTGTSSVTNVSHSASDMH
jgi:hypothetical protein